MGIQVLRGHIKDVAPPDDHGAAKCHIGDYNVKMHGDLVSSISKGDDVLLAGELKNDIFHAMAVKNFDKQGKIAQVDCTNYILLMGAGAFLFAVGAILGARNIGSGGLIESLLGAVSIIGLVGMVAILRRLLLTMKAASWVGRVGT